MVVTYEKTAMNGVDEYEDEMTVRVTDADPHLPNALIDAVAVVTVNDHGEATKNTGYIGMNVFGGWEAVPDHNYFPSSNVMEVQMEG